MLGVSRQSAVRWYSSEPEAKKDEEVKKDEKSEGEDPAKKELEAKNKEILELKVSCATAPFSRNGIAMHCNGPLLICWL